MYRILLVGMGGLYNRGCEAIVWGTTEVWRQINPQAEISVAVGYRKTAEIDRERLPDIASEIYPLYDRGTIPERALRRVRRTFLPRAIPLRPRWGFPLKGWDLILEVGGDTFATEEIGWRLASDQKLMSQSATDVGLWGMNFEPDQTGGLTKSQLTQAFSQYRLITVRDEPSRKLLSDLGVSKQVYRMADPAFFMRPAPWPVEEHLPVGERGIVGINMSPFAARARGLSLGQMARYTAEACTSLLDAGFGVLLVPHCFPPACPPSDDDMAVLTPTYESLLRYGNRVGILPSGISSPQVKHAIAQCVIFAGARMHSTIAAWSSGVPVLTLSYSAKSQNLNLAVYGHRRYLVDISTATPEQISESIVMISEERPVAIVATRTGVEHMLNDSATVIEQLRAEYGQKLQHG